MGRILIVEDSPTQAAQLRIILEAAGFEVVSASNADAALQAFRASDYDLVISDILMPGPSGYDLCRSIKGEPAGQDTPVILLSALNDPMDIVRGLECGADNFITKPYEPDQLVSRVKAVLENRRLRASTKFQFGAEVMFLGRAVTITSDKEQILDLLLSTFEDIVRTNRRLQHSQAELAAAKAQLETYTGELERRVSERTEALRERQEQLSRAQAIAHIGDWHWNLATGQVTWSDEIYRIFGLDRDSSIPRVDIVMEMVDPEDRSQLKASIGRAIADKKGCQAEFRINRPTGEQRYCWIDAICKLDAAGRVVELFGVVQDITDRKLAEIAARESNERYRRLVEHSPDGIFLMSDGRFVFANTSAARILGAHAPGDLIGRHVLDFVDPDHRELARERFARLATDGAHDPAVESKFLRFDGSSVDVDFSLSVVEYEGRAAVQVTVRDITQRKSMERQINHAQKLEAIGQLTGGLAHDFNNLLAVIIGNLDLLHPALEDQPDNQSLVDAALKASLHGADLTRRLLAFARRQQLQPEVIDLNTLVNDTTTLLRRTLGEWIEIELKLCDSLWLVEVDPSQVESALLNLAINARDAMPEGGRLTIATTNKRLDAGYADDGTDIAPGEYVALSVADTGTGIPPEILPQVFEPFFTTKKMGKGSGLGLSMIYGFIKQSGGHVKIHSELDHGTTVHLYLPRAAEDRRRRGQPSEAWSGDGILGRTVLVVEDNQEVRQTVVKQLTRLGCRTLEAEGPAEALKIVETGVELDLLFTDVVMPGISGVELARKVRELRPGLKVLLTSGFSEAAVLQNREILPFPILSKPYQSVELARKVASVFRETREDDHATPLSPSSALMTSSTT